MSEVSTICAVLGFYALLGWMFWMAWFSENRRSR